MRKIEKIKLDIQLFAEEQTLETKIKSTSDGALKSLESVIKKLNEMATSVDKVNKKITSGSVKTATKEMDNFANKVGKSVVSAQSLANALSFTALTAGLTRLTGLINDWVYETSDYSEQLNLFNVIFNNIEKNGKTTFSELGKSATQFQYKLNEAFGTSKTETFYMQGMFQAMGEAVNIPDKYSALMSETMTKLTYDMASLYNKQETDTAEALRAGVYAGQTKPLRSYGIDVTASSMQPILDELGIDRTVKQLNQAEKEVVRYITTLRQASNAMGDFANTIESPANQLKIFKQQLVETKVAITSLIMNLVGNLLPYLNALLMVIKEIAKWLATLLGIQLSDYNTKVASYGDAMDGIGKNADNATKSIKKLKREALGFDQIHNINENTGSGSGGGVNVGSGIDDRLLKALQGYDNGMEKVRMKATEIRDKIMDWLGFTKHVNSETGEVYFTYDGIGTTLKNIYDSFKKLTPAGKILTGLIVSTLLGGIFAKVKKIWTFIKGIKLIDKAKKLLTPFKTLGNYIKDDIQGGLFGIGNALKDSHSLWFSNLGIVEKIGVSVGGIVGLLLSLEQVSVSAKNLAEEGINFSNALGLAVGSVGSIVSGFILLGPAGAVGAGVLALLDGILTYAGRKAELERLNEFFEQNLGPSIQAVSDKISGIIEKTSEGFDTTKLSNYSAEYENAQEKIDGARTSIDNLIDSLRLQGEGSTLSKQEINELGNQYDILRDNTKKADDASRNYTIELIKQNGQRTNSTKETIATEIAEYKKLADAKKGMDIEYLNEREKYDIKLAKGNITQKEYNDLIYDLQVKYGLAEYKITDITNATTAYSDALSNINYKSVEDTNNAIASARDSYNSAMDALNSYKENITEKYKEMNSPVEEQISKLEETKKQMEAVGDTSSDSYKKVQDNLNTLTALVSANNSEMETAISGADEAIKKIQGEYKGYISAIYADLSKHGVESADEFEDTVDSIKEDLNDLKNVDMSGFGKEMFDSITASILKEQPNAIVKYKKEFDKLGMTSANEFTKSASEKVSSIYNDMIDNMGDKAIIPKEFKEIGEDSNEGFKNGLIGPQQKEKIKDTGKTFSEITEKSVRDGLKTHSPSKVFESIGKDTIDGLILGIDETTPNVISTLKTMIAKMKKEFDDVEFKFKISTNVENSFNSILSKLQKFTDKFKSGINTMLSKMSSSMNGIKVNSDGKITYTSMPSITVPKFANGGFPEDGLFYANHRELVGKFSNGKTAVANNDQIIEGIYKGVYSAVLSAMSQTQTSSQIDVHVHTDEGTVVDRINQKTKQTGVFPLNIPI